MMFWSARVMSVSFICGLACFSCNATATTAIYTLSLHDALPICVHPGGPCRLRLSPYVPPSTDEGSVHPCPDRKSTRLNSSHSQISYAVFCLKKKTHSHPHCLPTDSARFAPYPASGWDRC